MYKDYKIYIDYTTWLWMSQPSMVVTCLISSAHKVLPRTVLTGSWASARLLMESVSRERSIFSNSSGHPQNFFSARLDMFLERSTTFSICKRNKDDGDQLIELN